MENDYGFVVVHVPHASVHIPEEYKKTILLNETGLNREIRRMTDAFCDELYDAPGFSNRVVATVSRLVCDVERFRDDRFEPRARVGQGLMYTRTVFGKRLRMYDESVRDRILRDIYDPHHERLTAAVSDALGRFGKCLIIDGHSFYASTLIKPWGMLSRPDFDIGTDPCHTPVGLRDAICGNVRKLGYKPKVNTPFEGAITPAKYYGTDKRVVSIMFEVNRKLYMNEAEMTKSVDFDKTREACRALMHCAAEYVRGIS